jgi:hypothetical protein
MFRFDMDFLKALIRVIGSAPADFSMHKNLVLFTLYAMTMRKYCDRWTMAYNLIDMNQRTGEQIKGPLGSQFDDLLNVHEIDAKGAQFGAKGGGQVVIRLAQGVWQWPDEPQSLLTWANGITLGSVQKTAGTWLYKDLPADQTALTARFTELHGDTFFLARGDNAANESVVSRLAHAAYMSGAITALYNHLQWVSRMYTQAIERQPAGGAAGLPVMADSAKMGVDASATGYGAERVGCPPNTVPVVRVTDPKLFAVTGERKVVDMVGYEEKKFKDANGIADPSGSTEQKALAQMYDDMTRKTVPLKDGMTADGKSLLPGLSAAECLPAVPVSSVVAGTTVAGAPPVAPGPMPLAIGAGTPQPLVSRFLNIGGVPYASGFGATGSGPTPGFGFSADTVTSMSSTSPLVQQYFAHFNAPPAFHAVVVTPPSSSFSVTQ